MSAQGWGRSGDDRAPYELTVLVPTFNESPNVRPLVDRLAVACEGLDLEIVFADDSTDDTPDVIEASARDARCPVRLLHRAPSERVDGLGGAVVGALAQARGEVVVVMDGDLQHPPEMVPLLLNLLRQRGSDVVVASRYRTGGDASGLSGGLRHVVSRGCTALVKAMFPRRLLHVSDPMTGFFAVRRSVVKLDRVRPRGFKILLEILLRHGLAVSEQPFVFAARHAGTSKADLRQGIRFVQQLAALRFGRMGGFAAIGAAGAVLNLVIVAGLVAARTDILWAAVVAAEVTIVLNFLLGERLVFADLRHGRRRAGRFWRYLAVNNADALLRLPLLAVLVDRLRVPGVLAQALTLAVSFVVRFAVVSRAVYAPARPPVVVLPDDAPLLEEIA